MLKKKKNLFRTNNSEWFPILNMYTVQKASVIFALAIVVVVEYIIKAQSI